MKATENCIKNEDTNLEADTENGNKIIMDSTEKSGPKPLQMDLIKLDSNASYDVVSILQKARQAVSDVECQLSAKRADTIPAVFTDIHLHFVVKGSAIKEAQVKKAIELSAEKYCSASRMLENGGVKITHDYEIIDETSSEMTDKTVKG